MESDVASIVIDSGSHFIKAGYTGDDAPRAVFPTVSTYTPDPAIERGLVTDWDSMQRIWHHIFYNELRIDANEHPVFLSEPSFNPNANREKMAQIMFESFDVPALYLANHAVLALYSTGRTTGLIVDFGHGSTSIVPIYESHALTHATKRIEIGGHDLTGYMVKLLGERDLTFTSAAEWEIAQDIKEKLCYVAFEYEPELKQYYNPIVEKSYEMPNGRVITIGDARVKCPEAIFQPSLLGIESAGVHELVHNAIMKCDGDIQKELYNEIWLCGGNSMFEGLAERLANELSPAVVGSTMKVRVRAPPERKYSVWIGGSIFASLGSMQDKWIAKSEYDENGPSIVRRKCF